MWRSIKQLSGDKLGALDGEIGHVKDFYFDDRSWAVRYVVADTGSWLTGRQVLISLSPAGQKALDRERALRQAWVTDALEKLTEKELKTLNTALDLLNRMVQG